MPPKNYYYLICCEKNACSAKNFYYFFINESFQKYNAKKNRNMKKPDPDAETCPNTATLNTTP